MREVYPKVPIILAGNKVDLQKDIPERSVTEEEGEKVRRKIKAKAHVQCSAKDFIEGNVTNDLVDKVFMYAIKYALESRIIYRPVTQCTLI